jgi:hypothetical protein
VGLKQISYEKHTRNNNGKMKEELTKQEEALTLVVRDKWINKAYNDCSMGIDKSKFETGISWLYNNLVSLPNPQVIYCDSIIDAIIKITMFKDFNMDVSEYPTIFEKYKNSKLKSDFLKKMDENKELKSSYIGWSNFGWISFYDYFTQIGVLNDEKFNMYQSLIESNVFETFEFENVVFAVQPPKYILSENLLPHNTEDFAIEFNDGTGCYFINGLNVDADLFLKLKNRKYTFSDFIKEENEETKSMILLYIESRDGTEAVFDFMRDNLKQVDSFMNDTKNEYLEGTTRSNRIGVYTLFKGQINDVNIAYVRCYCPSTDRMFFLGVEPSYDSAKDAIASLYRVPTILKNNIVSISRQGEKFSTIFDDDITYKLENGEFSNDELQRYSSLSGNDYFKLMTYEF